MLENAALVLGFSVRRREEVLGVIVVDHLLEPGGTEGCQEQRHYDEVPRVGSDHEAQFVEPALERLVDVVVLARHGGGCLV